VAMVIKLFIKKLFGFSYHFYLTLAYTDIAR